MRKAVTDFDPKGFTQFWGQYARKEARKDAYKAWCQKQPDLETQDKIHDALAWQIEQWAADNFRFVPLAGTYLRGERWTDERRSGADRRVAPRHQVGRRKLVPDDEPL